VLNYRVVDLTREDARPEHTVRAKSPEAAAQEALGLTLVRSGRKNTLAAQVYWQPAGEPLTMVRLYRLLEADVGTTRRRAR
jgi:hypothetical protein